MMHLQGVTKSIRGRFGRLVFGLAGLVSFYSACESVVQLIKNAVVAAAIAAIQANGGVAVLVKPGQAFTLEVDDPNNPLYGTKVDLPADALPEQVIAALLSIEPSNFTASKNPAQRRIGPPAEIRLRPYDTSRDAFSDERIELRRRVTVRMPYPITAVSPAEATSVVVGHQENPDDQALTVLTDVVRSSQETLGLVSGGTLKFSPFMAISISSTTGSNSNTDNTDNDQLTLFTGNCLESQDNAPFDGTFDYFIRTEFTNGFRQVQSQYGPPPTGGPALADSDYYYEWLYNAAGNDVTFENEYITGGQYIYNSTVNITRNSSAQPLTETKTEVGFGMPTTTTYAYDGQGRLTSVTHQQYGSVYTYTYDSNGRIVGRSYDGDGEGGDSPRCDTYTYNSNGNVASAEYFPDCPGSNAHKQVQFTNCPAAMLLQHFGVPR